MLDTEYYKVSEISTLFKVSKQAVYGWIAEGKLRAVKVGGAVRIPKSALEPFVHAIDPNEIKPENADDEE
jgi:excisionase family DNA binding protein